MNGFAKYLERTNQSYAAFGRKCGKPLETVRRWALGLAKPQGDNMDAALQAANYEITPNDFYPNAN